MSSATTAETSAGETQMPIRATYKLHGLPELDKALVKLSNQDIEKALTTGFRRTSKSIPGFMARGAAKFYTAKQRQMKDAIQSPIVRPTNAGAEIQVRSSAAPFSGRLFSPLHGVRWVDKKNASIKVFKGGKRTPRNRGFRNPAFAKGGPFVRTSDQRLPISKMTGPSFHHLFIGGKHAAPILEFVDDKASEKLHKAVVDSLRAKSRGFLT